MLPEIRDGIKVTVLFSRCKASQSQLNSISVSVQQLQKV